MSRYIPTIGEEWDSNGPVKQSVEAEVEKLADELGDARFSPILAAAQVHAHTAPALWFQAMILDVDGTLVDSNDAHARAWVEAMEEAGIQAPFDEVRRCIGMGGDKLLPAVTGIREDTPRGRAISKRRGEIFRERYLPTLQPTPAARELLEFLASAGVGLAVASSAKKDELDRLLHVCGANKLVSARTSADDADNSKPDPDIVKAALAQVAADPSEVAMLGDTPYDVEAATRAGIKIIALRCGGWKDADLTGAVSVHDDPADLLAYFLSPP